MNDRYLYRAKRADNGEWIIASLVYCENASIGYEYMIMPTQIIGNWSTVLKDTICQCTGLKDKNDKLIWENDICDRKEEYPEIVKYHDGDWMFDYNYASNNESGFNYCNLGFYVTERNCVEVIGNIFDNPELLEK